MVPYMPKYFFNFVTRHDRIDDRRGVELDNISQAHGHALGLVRRTLETITGQVLRDWRIEVADGEKRIMLTVLFFAPGLGQPATLPSHAAMNGTWGPGDQGRRRLPDGE